MMSSRSVSADGFFQRPEAGARVEAVTPPKRSVSSCITSSKASRWPTTGRRIWTRCIKEKAQHSLGLHGSAGKLLRGLRECRQLADVARVVLDDDRRLEVLLHPLDALERGDRVGAAVIEARHAVANVILVEVRCIAEQDHRPLLLEAHEHGAMPWRVTRRAED